MWVTNYTHLNLHVYNFHLLLSSFGLSLLSTTCPTIVCPGKNDGILWSRWIYNFGVFIFIIWLGNFKFYI